MLRYDQQRVGRPSRSASTSRTPDFVRAGGVVRRRRRADRALRPRRAAPPPRAQGAVDARRRRAGADPARDNLAPLVPQGEGLTEFVAAARRAREAQADWAAMPAPRRGRAIQQIGRIVEANKEALARLVTREIGKPLRRVARRGPGGHRHLRLLPRRGPPPVRADRPERDARQAAVHVPRAGRRRGDRHAPATSRSPCRPGTSSRRCCAATPSSGSRPSTRRRSPTRSTQLLPARRPARRACSTVVLADGPTTFAGLERALDEGLVDKVGFTGSSDGRPPDRRALRPPPAVAVPRARRQEPDGRHARRRPRPRRRGRAVQRLRDGRPALHVARHGDRRTTTVHDEFLAPLHRARSRPRRSATRRRTSSTGR